MENSKKIAFVCGEREDWELIVRLVGMVSEKREVIIVVEKEELKEEVENVGFIAKLLEEWDVSNTEIIVVVGNSKKILQFASTTQKKQKIIHLENLDSGQKIGNMQLNSTTVGSLKLDNHKNLKLMSPEGLAYSLFGFRVDRDTVLVNYVPQNLKNTENLLKALDIFLAQKNNRKIIITKPKTESGDLIKNWAVQNEPKAIWFKPMGIIRRLSILQFVGGVVGNYKSDELDAPIFQTPYINIQGQSCNEILHSLNSIETIDRAKIKSPYYSPNTAQQILTTLLSL